MGMRRLLWLCLMFAALAGCTETAGEIPADAAAEIPEEKYIALTFDDGPRRDTTGRLLDGLKERNVPATFFLIGQQLEENQDLVKRMQEEGHQVGSHTWSHVRLLGISSETVLEEVNRTDEMLEEILGEGEYWLRPPYGAVDDSDKKLIPVPMIKWSIDPRDWEKKNTDEIVTAVLDAAAPNQIILLHDIYDTSVDAALRIVDELQEEGYWFVTVRELLEKNGIVPQAGVLYTSGG